MPNGSQIHKCSIVGNKLLTGNKNLKNLYLCKDTSSVAACLQQLSADVCVVCHNAVPLSSGLGRLMSI